MADFLTTAEEENKTLKNTTNPVKETKDKVITSNTPEPEKKDFATEIFEKISKPKFAGNFDSKDKVWEKYQGAYERDHGENAQEAFDAAFEQSSKFHQDLAMQELEDTQLSQVLDDAAWALPFGDDTEIVDPSMSTTTKLETNSGRLQMLDWWTGANNSVREASISAKSYINGNGELVNAEDIDNLSNLLDTTDSTGKEIIGFQYTGASEYTRGDATLEAVYRGERATGELATVWDLKDTWLSNNDLTSNIAKTTVGSVMNFAMDILDTGFVLAGATAGVFNDDSDFYHDMMEKSMKMQQYSMNKSDYDMSKMFTVNNMLDMAINTGLQLLMAGGVAGGANALSKMVIKGGKKAAFKMGMKTGRKTVTEIAELAGKQYGKKAGLFVLGGMASKDAYQAALDAGFTTKEAGAIYFASFAAMFQVNKISNFTDGAIEKAASTRFGNEAIKTTINKLAAEAGEGGLKSNAIGKAAISMMKSTGDLIKKLGNSGGMAGAMFTEAMEEEAELVAQEAVNHMANMYSEYLGYKDDIDKPKFKSVMDEGYWEEKGWEALMSGIGGALGGGMAKSVRMIRSSGKHIADNDWPVKGDDATAIKHIAFEDARGTAKGKSAAKKLFKTLEKEKNKGRFGRQDYSTVWNSEEGRYKRMSELTPEEGKKHLSQADVLYNTIHAQYNHYKALFSGFAGSYDQVIANTPEIQGIYGQAALFDEVNDLLTTKQDILAKSKGGMSASVDTQINAILDRESAILDTVIKQSEAEVDRFKMKREQDAIIAEESKDTEEKKAKVLKEGQDEEVLELKEEAEQSMNSKVEKMLLDEINKVAGALDLTGGEMKTLLETQRKLNDVQDGKFVEKGIINTLINTAKFRDKIGPGAPKKYTQYGNIVENLVGADMRLKDRITARKADGIRFTESFKDQMQGIPSKLEDLSAWIDNTNMPFLTDEQKQKLKLKIQKSVPSMEEIRIEIIASHIKDISSNTYKLIGEPFEVVIDPEETSKSLLSKVNIGVQALAERVLKNHLAEDITDIPENTRRTLAKILHAVDSLKGINEDQSEDISRMSYDPEEVDLNEIDEHGYEISVNDFLDIVNSGTYTEVLDTSTVSKKQNIPEEIVEADRLIGIVDKAEDPLSMKEFDGEYFVKNLQATNTGLETLDQSLGEAYKVMHDSAPKDESGEIFTFTDTEGANDLRDKIAIRKAQIELIQRSFKIIADVRGYNKGKFVGGFDESTSNNTYFSDYVNNMIGDPLTYFELHKKLSEGTLNEEEAAEFKRISDIVGSPDGRGSALNVEIDGLDVLDKKVKELLDMASNSSENLKQNYYVSTINYLNDLSDSARNIFNGSAFEGNEEIAKLRDEALTAEVDGNITATEEGAIAALRAVVKIKNALYKLGNTTLESGKLGRESLIGYGGDQDIALTSMFYNPARFNQKLKEVLELLGAGKEPKNMKLSTVDQLIVEEQVVAHTTTGLNKYLQDKSSAIAGKDLNVNVVTVAGLQGTGKTDIVAGPSIAIAQKELANKFGNRVTDHRALMCGNTVKQCAKLHESAKRAGAQIASIDNNESYDQFKLYELLTTKDEGQTDEEHIKIVKEKLDGIDLILYDEASYIEFLDRFPKNRNEFATSGVLNTMLVQLSKVNNLRAKTDPKLSIILMGDSSQGGFMEGMKSPRNPQLEFNVTGTEVQGAMGSGRLPKTRELTKSFRFEVPSLKSDIESFRDVVALKSEGLSVDKGQRVVKSSWNVISNDKNGKLGGIKYDTSWNAVCDDKVVIDNIREQFAKDKDFDMLIVTNEGVDSIPEDSELRKLYNEFSSRIEIATLYSAQGSEVDYTLVNVPNNMLSAKTDKGTPLEGEVNIVSMAMGRSRFFSQVAVSGTALDLSSTEEVEITKQSEPEVAMFRESWFRVLNEGLFEGDLTVEETEEMPDTEEKPESIIKNDADETVVVDLNEKDVESPTETEARENKINNELGIVKGDQETIDNKKQELSDKLKDKDLSDNERSELESELSLVKNMSNPTDDGEMIESLDTEEDENEKDANERKGRRTSSKKLELAEEAGTIMSYSTRNRAAGATPISIGIQDQINDTDRIFGSSMSKSLITEHQTRAMGHNGEKNMDDYEYRFITYQFPIKNGIGTNSGMFAKPKNSPGDWFMVSSSLPETNGEIGNWLRGENEVLSDARNKAINDKTDVTLDDYAELILLPDNVEIIAQKGGSDNTVLFALNRKVIDGTAKLLIQGTTAGSIETDPIQLSKVAKTSDALKNVAARIMLSTKANILDLPNGTSMKNRVTDNRVIKELNKIVSKKGTTEDALKSELFEEVDEHKVTEITIGENEYPIVMVKTARGTIPFLKQAESWSPFLGITNGKILVNKETGTKSSKFYDAELNKLSSNLDQLLTDDKTLEQSSIGLSNERANTLVTSNLRVNKSLLESDREMNAIASAIMGQFYDNLPQTLDRTKVPLAEAIDLIKATSGPVSFSRPMVVSKGKKAGHSLVFYTTTDTKLEDKSAEDLQELYRVIAANRTPDEDSVQELLGLNRDGIGVLWLDQKGYTLSELNNIVENTETKLSKSLFQLATWGNANDSLVAMFTAIAKTNNIFDSSERLDSLLEYFEDKAPLVETDKWAKEAEAKNPEAMVALNELLTYIFSIESMGKVSTYFTSNSHLDNLLGIQDEGRENGLKQKDILLEMQEYIAKNPDENIDKVLEEYGITIDQIAHLDLASAKSGLSKGELARNKKTGKPVVNYDVIRYIPNDILTSLTGKDENITPEISLVNLFERLNHEKFADHKDAILGMLDDLLPNIEGFTDNIYASPYITVKSDSTLEVGVSPDNGDLMQDLSTSAKMIARPGVALDIQRLIKGNVFANLREQIQESTTDTFEDTKKTITETTQSILEEVESTENPDFDGALNTIKELKKSHNLTGDEKLTIDSIIQTAVDSANKLSESYQAELQSKKTIDPVSTELMEKLGVSAEDTNELGLYEALHELDFIRQKFFFDNASVEAYVRALEQIDIPSYIKNPARATELIMKREDIITGLSRSISENPVMTMNDTDVNMKLTSLDFDNPTKISTEFLNQLNPEDNSLEDWERHKTSRPSIPHLYAILSNGDIDEATKVTVAGILKQGIGRRGKKIRIQIISMLNSGKYNPTEYKRLLDSIVENEGQEAANKFAQEDAVTEAFDVFNRSRNADAKGKIAELQKVYNEALTLKEADQLEVLTELKSTLDVLFKNGENLQEAGNSLYESVEKSLNSSIISESHLKGELTLSQQMMNIFENTVTYKGSGLSDEAQKIFDEIKVDSNAVSGLQGLQNFIQNPTEAARPAYLESLDQFKGYLRSKTSNRSILREFNKMISESFCQ